MTNHFIWIVINSERSLVYNISISILANTKSNDKLLTGFKKNMHVIVKSIHCSFCLEFKMVS